MILVDDGFPQLNLYGSGNGNPSQEPVWKDFYFDRLNILEDRENLNGIEDCLEYSIK